jgi:hypothetical protein
LASAGQGRHLLIRRSISPGELAYYLVTMAPPPPGHRPLMPLPAPPRARTLTEWETRPVTAGDDLAQARRLLPEGSQVTGTISLVPKPGVIGVFVDLPDGMGGFVDVLTLPRDAKDWPQPGEALRFEVLQHRRGQVRLWPLEPRFRHDDAAPQTEAEWRHAKLRYPVGSIVPARVDEAFPANQEYRIRFADGDDSHWSCAHLSWTGQPPVAGTIGQYQITAHLDTTRRIIAAPAG